MWPVVADEQRLAGASLLVFANKQDIPGAITPAQIKEVGQPRKNSHQQLHLDDLKTHSWRIQASSAYTGENVEKGMEWIINDIGMRLYYYGPSASTLSNNAP